MSSRAVSVVLTAQVQNYLSNMRAAEQRTLDVEKAARTATQQFAKHNEALTKVGVGMLAVGATAAAGLALAVKAATEYGAKMAQLQSLSHASAQDMQRLSDAAMTQGRAYGFTASQVADAQIELVKAGQSTADILGGSLKGALTLAAAGQIDVGQATEIATVAMTQFGLAGKDIPHVADLLAAGADKALGSVGDLGEALKNGGLQAHNMGMSIDDTVGLLSAFANAGIIGAEAGTQMRSMFIQLQRPSAQARAELEKHNIALADQAGKFVGVAKLGDELRAGLGKLTQEQRNTALATIFGSHAITGATVLYQDSGKAAEKAGLSIADWIRNVNDAGFASAQAAGKMNSLQGDVQKLAAAFQTDLIKAGMGAAGPLRGVVQAATNLTTAFGDLDPGLQSAAMGIGTVVAGVGLLGGAALVAVPKIAALRATLDEAGISGKAAVGSFAALSVAVVGVTSLMSGMGASSTPGVVNVDEVKKSTAAIQDHYKNVSALFKGNFLQEGGVKAAFDAEQNGIAASNKGLDGLLFNATKAGDVYRHWEGQLTAFGTSMAATSKIDYRGATQSFNNLVTQIGGGTDRARKLIGLLGPDYQRNLAGIAKGIGVTASSTNLLAIASGKGAVGQQALAYEIAQSKTAAAKQADSLATLAGQASSATTDIGQLQSAIEGFGSAQLDARGATRAMYQAVDDATAAAVKNGRTLDVHTQKGRDNQAALDGIAKAADLAASKTLKQTGDTAKAAAVMQTGRDAFIKAATAMTGSGTAAKRLADQLGLIPGNIEIAVKDTGFEAAKAALAHLQDKLDGLRDKTISVKVQTQIEVANSQIRVAAMAASGVDYYGNPVKRAAGGAIDGAGPKGVDSVPAILAPGEHVLTDKDVDRLGGQAGVYRFRAALAVGDVQAYAKGGAVSKRRPVHHPAPKPKTRKPAKRGADSTNDDQIVVQDNRARSFTRIVGGHDADAIRRAKAAEKTRQRQEAAAQKRYDAIGGGRKDAAAKRQARAALNTAKQRAKAATDAVTKAEQARTADIAKRDAAKASAAQLRLDREDFVSAERRDPNRRSTDPLAYVDQLRAMSRDGNYTAGRRKAFDTAANKYESELVKLTAASATAAQKLTDLQQASDQLRSSTRQAITGGYTLAGAAQSQTASGWVTRDGIRYQTTSTGPTAGSIAAYYTAGAGSARSFAAMLQQLAGRGLNVNLLAEVAGMGTDAGTPIAQALLSASTSELDAVNQGYSAIGSAGDAAGGTVADATYAGQIAAADANAKMIADQIATDGEKLRKLIATAFGLKGYAVGTNSATPGIHLVGEHGPELVGFRGGEKVLTAGQSARWIRGVAGTHGGGQQISLSVAMPKSLDLVDAGGGLISTVKVVARGVAVQEIAADALHDAVLMSGGAA